jgi:hypothetical protein
MIKRFPWGGDGECSTGLQVDVDQEKGHLCQDYTDWWFFLFQNLVNLK